MSLDLSRIPVEVLELILSKLTDPVSQRRLAQVTWNIVRLEDDLPVRCAECGGWQSSDSGGSDLSPGSGNSTSGHIYSVII